MPILGIAPGGEGGGHAVMIIGYNIENTDEIEHFDPATGKYEWNPNYTYFLGGIGIS